MSKERESGYYHVIFDNKTWEVAKYDHLEEEWQRFSVVYERFKDWDFDEIDETPIKREENE